MKKIVTSILILFLTTIFNINISLATENLYIITDSKTIIKNENFKIYINIKDIKVAAYNLNIYFDNNIVEYVSGSENTNVSTNKIINVWYDESGGQKIKQNQEIAVFEFKAKETGTTSFNLIGEFFDSNGNKIEVNNANLQIDIKETEENNSEVKQTTEKNNNSLLKIMRLDKEGIIPEFSPDIKDYYFLTDLNTDKIDITAISESENAKVEITGNENLKEGLNKILIKVVSSDNSNETIYTINVTKTNNKEAANTNLETLAIENVTLEPLFDINTLNYKASIPNNTENLNIFAVPENINGKVEITGKDNLQEGDNIVKVRVTAPNGYSYKDYVINVHRRTQEEDKIFEEEQKQNSENLNNIIDEKGIEFLSNENAVQNVENNENDKKTNSKTVFIILGLIMIVGVEIFVILKIKSKNKK